MLIDNGYMTKSEAAVHIALIMKIFVIYPEIMTVKYNIRFDEFWQNSSNFTGWIRENEAEIKANKKNFRLIQMLLSDFNFELFDKPNLTHAN